MEEEKIRPERLMQECTRLYKEDVAALLEHKKDFVSVPCPACESEDRRPAFGKGGFKFVSCGSCETLYINPRPSRDLLAEYYADSKSMKFWNDSIFPASEDSRREHIFAPRAGRVVGLCKKYGVKPGVLLDAGAGFGTFCEEVIRLGYFGRVVAVEPSSGLAATCRAKSIETVERPIEEVEMGGADVITNFELVEHLFQPREFLLACREALADGGLLILTTPNIKGFDFDVLGSVAENIGGPNHLNYFHPASLAGLLGRCGFDVVEMLTPGKLDAELVRKKVLSCEFDISGMPFLKRVLIDEWDAVHDSFQEFLADNMMSSHLWVVARKTGA